MVVMFVRLECMCGQVSVVYRPVLSTTWNITCLLLSDISRMSLFPNRLDRRSQDPKSHVYVSGKSSNVRCRCIDAMIRRLQRLCHINHYYVSIILSSISCRNRDTPPVIQTRFPCSFNKINSPSLPEALQNVSHGFSCMPFPTPSIPVSSLN